MSLDSDFFQQLDYIIAAEARAPHLLLEPQNAEMHTVLKVCSQMGLIAAAYHKYITGFETEVEVASIIVNALIMAFAALEKFVIDPREFIEIRVLEIFLALKETA